MTDHPASVFSFTVHRFGDGQSDLIRRNSMELNPTETYQVIVCSKCYNEVYPTSIEQFKDLELIAEKAEESLLDGDETPGRNFRCPRCGEVVYWVSDTGMLEFGV